MAIEFTYSTKNAECAVAYARFYAMHTRMEIVLPQLEEQMAQSVVRDVEQRVSKLERLMNRFDNASPLAMVNAVAATQAVELDGELFMALELCEVFRRGTGGYFDVAAAEQPRSGAAYLLDGKSHTIRLASADVKIDLGGFAKGFALEQVCRMLRESGVESGVVNFGNSSIAALGHHPYGEWWPIGVANRKCAGAVAGEFRLCDSALSVSGRAESGEYHILNPHTGLRVAGEELVAVEGRSALVAEVLSTALYAAPHNQRAEIMGQYEGYRATELYCRKDGTTERRLIENNR
ncbi:MAG: FAD:protein FMN transferase [Alistipes sp.]|nr:FAD:protein FMN transferase [Alistipes sp.]